MGNRKIEITNKKQYFFMPVPVKILERSIEDHAL